MPSRFVFPLLLLFPSLLDAFEIPIQNKLTSSDGDPGARFGCSVSLSGSLALVGAYFDDIGGNSGQGSAYLFDCSSLPCSQLDKLTASDGATIDWFGNSVSLSGSMALVGAYQDDIGGIVNQGSAYLFDCASLPCSQIDKLTASDRAANDNFGISVSLDGSLALVGAYRDDIGGNGDQGSAYLFDCASLPCSQIDKLTAFDGDSDDQFGVSVSFCGSLALVGASSDNIGGNSNQGSAYLFDCASLPCSQLDKLTASDGAANDHFGISVSLSGSLALVGAYGDEIGGNSNQGSAYVFNCTSFPCSQVDKLTASDGTTLDQFGYSVSFSGSLILVGAHGDDIGGNSNQGSAYLYDCSSLPCSQVDKLSAFDGASVEYFGRSVSLYDSFILVGAYYDNIGVNQEQGSAYFTGLFPFFAIRKFFDSTLWLIFFFCFVLFFFFLKNLRYVLLFSLLLRAELQRRMARDSSWNLEQWFLLRGILCLSRQCPQQQHKSPKVLLER